MKRIAVYAILMVLIALPVVAQDNVEQAPLRTLEEAITITDWWVVGPLRAGPREPLSNPLSGTLDPDTSEVDLDATYPSIHEFGGEVAWQVTTVSEEGDLSVSFENADWEKINEEWGVSGLYFSGAAYSTFESPYRCRAMVNASRIGSFLINGRLYSGDPYGHNLIQTPVILDEGVNHVFFMMGGFGGGDSVRFEILPPPETELVILDRDIMIGDIIRGEEYNTWAGVPVLNMTERWIGGILLNGSAYVYQVPPLSVVKISSHVTMAIPPEDLTEDTFEIPIELTWDGGSLETSGTARVRDLDDSRLVTFQSRNDFSTQKYGIRFPVNYDPEGEYSLILTTHGASVECEGQVNAFEAKDWAFVVAPTNRRRFGFDWQDWGRLDAIEVMDIIMEKYPIDPNRVYLVGHSMGGHGAWHIGCTHADRFAAVVPSAGWASFQLYVPWFLRSDEMFSDPACYRIFDQCTSSDRTERLLPNLRNVPVLAVHGGDDDDVPPTHARMLIGMLERMGYDARLWEEPGMGHWWDNSPNVPGTDCVDALRIRSFCMERERNPYPRHVTFASFDLANNNSMYWIRVDQEISPIGRIYVDAELMADGKVVCETSNVARILFNFDENWPYARPSKIVIDRQEIDIPSGWTEPVPLLKTVDGEWIVGYETDSWVWDTTRFDGPIKRAYFSPFIIIAGQSGTVEQNELNLQIARNLSTRWWYRANGYVQVFTDHNLPYDLFDKMGNWILIGGPESNSFSLGYLDTLPVRMNEHGVRFGEEWIEGEDLAVQFVYPRPDAGGLIHCIWGNSYEGMRLSGGLNCIYSGNNQPDFIVWDEETRLWGFGGVRMAGFFDPTWELDAENYYLRNRGR